MANTGQPGRLSRDEVSKRILKQLRKRDAKTAAQLAEEAGVPLKATPHSIRALVESGDAVSDGGRRPKYTKGR